MNEAWTRFGNENGGLPGSIGVGASYLDVCRKCGDATVLEGLASVLRGKAPIFRHEYRCDGPQTLRWFLLTATPCPTPEGGALVHHRDITEYRFRAEIHRRTLEHVRAIIWTADAPSFRTLFLSGQVDEILGFPAQAWLDDPDLWKKQLHPEDREWVLEQSRKAIREGRNHEFDYRMLAADGHTVWLHQTVNLVHEPQQPLHLIGISFDVSPLKHAQDQLQIMGGHLLRAQDEERARIARELHDDIGQRLSIVSIDLGLLETPGVKSVEEFHGRVADAKKQISEIIKDLSCLSHGLHSYILDSRGLAAASADFCKELSMRRQVAINFHSRHVPKRIPREVSLSLFRVLQEALQNGVKHSRAKTFEVKLLRSAQHIDLTVSDAGRGFDLKNAAKGNGFGLTSMEERLKLIGGDFSIVSRVRGGTTVRARVPLNFGRQLGSVPSKWAKK